MTTLNELGARQVLETLNLSRKRMSLRRVRLQTQVQEITDDLDDLFLLESLAEQQAENLRALITKYEDARKDLDGESQGEPD